MSLPSSTATGTSGCGACGSRHSRILHFVRISGFHRRLCTSCVLRSHPGSYCPSCFQLHDPSPPVKRLTCSKCNSITHPHCVPNPPSPYICPPCSSPSFAVFGPDNPSSPNRLDVKAASVLLCAAKIASVSMQKARSVAAADAEKKVRDAAMARRTVRELLERIAGMEDKARREEGSAADNVSGVKFRGDHMNSSDNLGGGVVSRGEQKVVNLGDNLSGKDAQRVGYGMQRNADAVSVKKEEGDKGNLDLLGCLNDRNLLKNGNLDSKNVVKSENLCGLGNGGNLESKGVVKTEDLGNLENGNGRVGQLHKSEHN